MLQPWQMVKEEEKFVGKNWRCCLDKVEVAHLLKKVELMYHVEQNETFLH